MTYNPIFFPDSLVLPLLAFLAMGIVLACVVGILQIHRARGKTTGDAPSLPTDLYHYGLALTFFLGTATSGATFLFTLFLRHLWQWQIPVRELLWPGVCSLWIGLPLIYLLWRTYPLTRDLVLVLFSRKRNILAELFGWLALIPGIQLLIQLVLTCRLLYIARSRRLRLQGLLALVLLGMALTPPGWPPSCFWLWPGISFLLGAAVNLVLARTAGELVLAETVPLRSGWRRRFLLLAVIPLLLTASSVGLWIAFAVYARSRLNAVETVLAELGVPLTQDAMLYSRAKPADNALPFYEMLAAGWNRELRAAPGADIPVIHAEFYHLDALPADIADAVRQIPERHSGTIALLNDLPLHPTIRFPRNRDKHTLLSDLRDVCPEIQILRQFVRLQEIRLLSAYRSGDGAAIPELWRETRILRNWLHNDILIFAGLDCEKALYRSYQPILNRWRFSDAVLEEQISFTRTEEPLLEEDWIRLWETGTFQIITIFPDFWFLCWGNPDRPASRWELARWKSFPAWEILLLCQTSCLEQRARIIKFRNMEYFQVRKVASSFRRTRLIEEYNDWLASFADPPYEGLSRIFSCRLAELRILRTALAAELYRRKTGHWPEHLADLVPEFLDAVPRDPFDGEPLKMRAGQVDAFVAVPPPEPEPEPEPEKQFTSDEVTKIPDAPPIRPMGGISSQNSGKKYFERVTRPGFAVYSIGPDGVDDGGRPQSPEEIRIRTGDITFTWYDPPQEESR